MSVRIIPGDCREILTTLPDESVNCCVTSPPYWGLRDYGTARWEGGDDVCEHVVARKPPTAGSSSTLGYPAGGGVRRIAEGNTYHEAYTKTAAATCPACGARRIDSQIGLEPTPEAYVAELVAVFREVRRVLRADGTLWLNIGDSYGSGGMSNPSGASTLGGGKDRGASGYSISRSVPHGLKPKDLVGIPWRVAFALQQPYEHVVIKSKEDRAWLAAMIDGEGCITTNVTQPTTGINESYAIIVQLRMTDRECLDRIVEITGMSRVQDESLPPSAADAGQRPFSVWKIAGENAATVLAEVFPYLRIKRGQAMAAWNLQRLKDGVVAKRGVPVPSENMEKRRILHRVIRSLNQREPADMPSWVDAPTYTVEPGWYLRSDVIWAKPNPMPESVTDRPTKSHEYVFLLSKGSRYYFDAEAIKEEALHPTVRHKSTRKTNAQEAAFLGNAPTNLGRCGTAEDGTRNARSVWTIATQPFSGAHFATMPPKLAERCILAGCPEGGTVLDPFGGAGTTGLVADRLGRNAVLIELNTAYGGMAYRRIEGDAPLLAEVDS